ncbi:LAME_0E12508g1_1 [Lachancea meyersii CBS 8951]|uniref:LAME_0E12508g1_1 n=1 Tax=Lachancea meyersii CBS 8951 TaxID=1266667 RepID=A0A1G4JLN8_9SACH|nr:LAME_0E12508g1_1 [Lachancea meyersii CBS 8951]
MSALGASLRSLKWCLNDQVTTTPIAAFNGLISKQFQPNLKLSNEERQSSAGDHLLFFNFPQNAELSPDGYFDYQTPKSILKNENLWFKRRMWASGTMQFVSSLQVDRHYHCHETVRFVKPLKNDYYVGINRQVLDAESNLPVVNELRTLVYTQNLPSTPSAQVGWETPDFDEPNIHSTQLTFEDCDIFRYSALTYNSHRVHWDRAYCRNIEGYKDVIVQGPYMVHAILKYMQFGLGLSVSDIKYKNTHNLYPGQKVDIDASQKLATQWDVEIRDTNSRRVYCKASVGVK